MAQLEQLNQSVVLRDCTVNGVLPVYLQPLVDLRQGANSIPITDIVGRTSIQSDIFVNGLRYDDLAMRRKAEVLQYNGNSTKDSQKDLFSKMQFRKKMKNIDRFNNCPTIVYPPSNSGVKDVVFSGYYYNPTVPYYPSL